MKFALNRIPRLAQLGFSLTTLTIALSACSVIETDKVDYKSAGKVTNPNGWLAQMISSSASRDRCNAACAAAIR